LVPQRQWLREVVSCHAKVMRFLKITGLCLGGLILTLILTEVLSDTLGYFLFRGGVFGSDYDSAFPLAIVFSFVISAACVVVLFRTLFKPKSSKKVDL
jgi:hypothetical protein